MARIGIDVGGTFTDVVLVDESNGQTHVAKRLNLPGRRAQTVADGIRQVMASAGIAADAITFIGHGTTITTNAVIERKGARTALVANRGFRDTLELGRFSRPAEFIYRVQEDKPAPLVPRHLRLGVDCRIDASGTVLRDLDDAAIDRLVAALRASGVEAVAICLLFSFLDARHEIRLRDRLRAALPGVEVVASCDVQPEFREFPRTSTTVFAAYVAPVLRGYLDALVAELQTIGVDAKLFIFQSNGGVAPPDLVLRNPATTLLSGPAGAVVGAARLSAACGYPRLITMDMGGTSLDVCLLRDGVAEATTAREIDHFPVVTPMLDVHTIGAGGGSLCRLDEVGRIRVGPESAAADPGPACYGRGGSQVTLTDVNVVLGYVDPDNFAGGAVRLDVSLAYAAIETHIARPLGISVPAAAAGIFRVAASQMAEAIRFVSVQRGTDARDFDLCAFGGGGPIHAFAIAAELGMRRIIVPPAPGLFSAGGIALADYTHDYSASVLSRDATGLQTRVAHAFARLTERAHADFDTEGVEHHARRLQRGMDLRYAGQSTEINVRLASDDVAAPPDIEAFIAEFHRQHEAMYSYSVPGEPVEIVNVRVRATGIVGKPENRAAVATPHTPTPEETRDLWFRAGDARVSARNTADVRADPLAAASDSGDSEADSGPGAADTPTRAAIHTRERLRPGARVRGPAVIHELSSSTIVPPGAVATVDAFGNLVLELAGESR